MPIEKTPPTNPLHRQLWQMGFDLEQRQIIIDVATKMTIMGRPVDVLDLGVLCLPSMPQLPKQRWHIRFKFWIKHKLRDLLWKYRFWRFARKEGK
jgi:hypothetical protein